LYGATDPGKSPGFLTPQEYADWTWQAYKNTGQPLSHPQFGTGATPVLPDYLLVGALSGVSASAVNLTAEQAKYNNDSRNVWQLTCTRHLAIKFTTNLSGTPTSIRHLRGLI
jgi:TonB-dependent starch-binding outer membrane protein SusC